MTGYGRLWQVMAGGQEPKFVSEGPKVSDVSLVFSVVIRMSYFQYCAHQYTQTPASTIRNHWLSMDETFYKINVYNNNVLCQRADITSIHHKSTDHRDLTQIFASAVIDSSRSMERHDWFTKTSEDFHRHQHHQITNRKHVLITNQWFINLMRSGDKE